MEDVVGLSKLCKRRMAKVREGSRVVVVVVVVRRGSVCSVSFFIVNPSE